MNKLIYKWLGMLLFSSLLMELSSCANHNMILEAHDVHNFAVMETLENGGLVLNLSGLVFHSSFVVCKTDFSTKNDCGVICVELCPAKPGLSGALSEKFVIGPHINKVVFGKKEVEIWNRKKGSLFVPPKKAPGIDIYPIH